MKTARRYVLRTLIVLAFACTPLSCIPVLVVVNSVNPMQVAFITDFTVENQSGESVTFTPIGASGSKGDRSLLPIVMWKLPAIVAMKTGSFHLAPGESKRILYDWDDINFSEIAVRSDEGRFYELVVDTTPTENQYHAPTSDRFVIPALTGLPSISPRVREATGGMGRAWLLWLLMGCGLIPPIALWRLKVALRQARGGSSSQ